MQRTRLVPILVGSLTVLALWVAPESSSAQVTKDDAKCRKTANKNTIKYSSTANKSVAKCIKDRFKGKTSADCINPVDADSKGKMDKSRQKLIDQLGPVKDKCSKAGPAALAAYAECPSPGQAGTIGSFADVGDCLADVVARTDGTGMIHNLWKYILDVDYDDPALATKEAQKCVSDIAKNAGKLHDTVTKTLAKLQQTEDKDGGPYETSIDRTDDSKGKIAKTEGKLTDKVTQRCTGLSDEAITALGSCSRNVDEIDDCIIAAVKKNASGINAVSFEMSGTCPASVDVTAEGSFNNGIQTASLLSSGWTGLGHGGELSEGFRGAVELTCADGSCADCAVTASCDAGNCRCDGTPSVECDEPFGPDADDCGGSDCILFFGPPLPLSAGGTPACIVSRIPQDLAGTADIGTGDSETTVTTHADVYASGSAVSAASPCPRCQGDATPNDGLSGGTCELGANAGDPCDANFTNPVLGDTSYDCQPDSSPTTLVLPITLSPSAKSQAFGLDSTVVGPALQVPCNVCSGDATLACDSDAVCSDAGAGTCDSSGPGAGTLPNSCGDFVCGADGTCTDGTSTTFCDVYVKQSGDGVIACLSNADCTALDPECPGGDCGECTLVQPTSCFPDPVVNNSGSSAQDGAVLTAQFCTPPTGTGIDNAAGQPGLSDLSLEFDFIGRCPNGDEWELGGNNCTP